MTRCLQHETKEDPPRSCFRCDDDDVALELYRYGVFIPSFSATSTHTLVLEAKSVYLCYECTAHVCVLERGFFFIHHDPK